jgi:hypothetical protein
MCPELQYTAPHLTGSADSGPHANARGFMQSGETTDSRGGSPVRIGFVSTHFFGMW